IGHQPTVGVVEVVLTVVAIEDRELSAVHSAQLICCNTEHQRHEGINLQDCLSSVFSDPQGSGASPLPCDRTQVGAVCPGRSASPLLSGEHLSIDIVPKISVGLRDTVETQGTSDE